MVDDAEKRDPRWRKIPELNGVDAARAAVAYRNAVNQSWDYAATWCAAVIYVLILGTLWVIEQRISNALRSHGFSVWVVKPVSYAIVIAAIFAATRLFQRIHRDVLRRCVRAELGTHCRNCDYDLRATPDLPPPQVPRCPECGTPIPRNVHRQTLRND